MRLEFDSWSFGGVEVEEWVVFGEASLSVRLLMTLFASARSEGVESGDWFICGGDRWRGVENAPVDWRCSVSKSSCSSFGRRGGEGPGRKGRVGAAAAAAADVGDVVEKGRWWRWRLWRLRVKREEV